jgi:heme exporter protein C
MTQPISKRTPESPLALTLLAVATGLAVCATLYAIFAVAPVERQMGIVQKIFYFHVPSAYAMYVGFTVSAVASAVYLGTRNERWDAIAVAGAEVGSLFCLIVLVTGPLWARKAWGTFWTWDPRLTTTLLAGMVFFAYLVLRSFGGAAGAIGEVEKRFAAGLAVFGLLDLPIIHYSVQRWRGTHPTVITGKGGGLHPDMRPALIMGFVLFSLVAALLIWQRTPIERLRQRCEALELEAAERGLGDDDMHTEDT